MTPHCDIHDAPITDRDYIVVDEGGSVPVRIVCVPCLGQADAIAPDTATQMRDDAVIGEGHTCIDYGVVIRDPQLGAVVQCSLCLVLMQDVPVQTREVTRSMSDTQTIVDD